MVTTGPRDGLDLWQFVNRLPDVLLWHSTADGQLSYVSDGLVALLGSTRENLLDNPGPWNDRIYHNHRRRYARAMVTASEANTYVDIEYRARLPRIGTTYLRDHIVPDSESGGLFGITTQIGEQRETAERLGFLNKAARIFARTLDSHVLLEELGDLIAGSVADVCIIETETEDGPSLVVRADGRKRLQQQLEQAGTLMLDGRLLPAPINRGRGILHETLTPASLRRLLGPERVQMFGKKRPHAAIVAPLMVRRRLLGLVTFLCTDEDRDYTARDLELARDVCQQAALSLDHARLFEAVSHEQEKLAAENEMKDEFLALMSHELRTPLTVIYAVSRILPRVLPPLDKTATEFVENLYTSSERTVRLVDDLMLLARLNLGEAPELEPMPVGPFLEEVGADFRRQYPENTLTIADNTSGRAALGAPPYIRQVLLNLLVNAHKYSPSESTLYLSAAPGEADRVVFTVIDSGTGVPEAELDHLFDRFYRASTSQGVSGSGMGLAICRRLVEALGGTIWARNIEDGGLAVSFDLPEAQ